MQRRQLLTSVLSVSTASALGACSSVGSVGGLGDILSQSAGTSGALSIADIGAGLKEALNVGAGRAVSLLAVEDGFFANPDVKIPLPSKMQSVRETLDKVGFGSPFNDLELQMNRAAEQAAPQARDLFVGAITDLTLEDVQGIYTGGNDAATTFLRSKTAEPLAQKMTPIIDGSLANVGAVNTFSSIMGRYNQIPFVPKVETNLTGHVVNAGLDGIFLMLGREEAAIRQDPLKRSTDLLRRVFT